MPVPFSAANLKARFEDGDTPAGQDFADLIDTLFNLIQTANDNAAAALALANSLQGGVWFDCTASFLTNTNVINMQQGVASISQIYRVDPIVRFRVNFTTPFANNFYIVERLLLTDGGSFLVQPPATGIIRTANYFEFQFSHNLFTSSTFQGVLLGQI